MHHQNSTMLIMLFIVVFFPSLAKTNYISFDLIHKDSILQSPLYNHSLSSSSQLFPKNVRRFRARVNRLNLSSSYIHEKAIHTTELKDDGNNYVISYLIGSKKARVYGYLDITTDFIWTRCDGPLFDYQQPQTHFVVPSISHFCKLIPFRNTVNLHYMNCRYDQYEVAKMGLSTSGFVIRDEFFLQSNHTHEGTNVFFGCADPGLASEDQLGVFGFGKGRLSLPSQLKTRKTTNRFSYCLLPPKELTSSKLMLGALPSWLERLMERSPLQLNSIDPSSYYLNLNVINIGGYELSMPTPHPIKIDSGTSMTFLENSVFQTVKQNVTNIIPRTPLNPSEYGLCYTTEDLGDIKLPSIVFHFDQASFHIQSESLFIQNEGQTCMSILSIEGIGSSVFGSIAQESHVMQFDLKKNEVSFTRDQFNCRLFSQHW